jgi:hypothetical protein
MDSPDVPALDSFVWEMRYGLEQDNVERLELTAFTCRWDKGGGAFRQLSTGDISVEVSVQQTLQHLPDQINEPRQLPGLAVDLIQNLRLLVLNLFPSREKVG